MRRLWAYIILAVTALLLVGASFVPVFTQANANIEFKNGYDMYFRISNKGEDGEKSDDPLQDPDAVNEIADIFETRLEKTGISNYRIAVEGNDTIKVSLAQENTTDYYMVVRYLSFNGSLALANSADDYVLGKDFLNGEAKLQEKNGYPCIVIPVKKDNSDYSALIESTKNLADHEGEAGYPYGESEQDEEGNTQSHYFIYLWYDYQKDYDTYAQTINSSSEYKETVASKIFVKFNIEQLNVINDSGDADYENYISTVLTVDSDGDGTASLSEIKNAYKYGKFYVNLLNASSLDYKVELLYTTNTSAWAENVFSFGQHVGLSLSRTLIATFICIVIIALILYTYFKLGTLSVGAISLVSLFAGAASIILVSSEFNVGGLVGLVLLAVVSLVSGIIYLSKLKEEAYKGRSLKKANAEAAKKSLLPIVDVNVVLIIAGIFTYIFGGALLRTFAAVAVIGGLASLILNTLALRGMMWLATNATCLQGKYERFGIESDKVPNLMAEEKQSYFGAYAEKDLTTHKKPIAIGALILLVASIAGIVTFGIIGKGQVYSSGSGVTNSEIFFETTDEKSALNLGEIQTILDNLKVNGKEFNKYVAKDGSEYLTEYHTAAYTEKGETVNYYVYTVTLNAALTGEEDATYEEGTLNKNGKLNYVLTEVLADKNFDEVATVEVKQGKIVSQAQPKFVGVLLAGVVSIAVSGLYLLLRYRLTRGLTAIISALVSSAIAAGIFALLRLAVGSYVALALVTVSVVAYLFAIIFMNKERDLIIDDKTRNNSVENRNEIMKKANSMSYEINIVAFIVAASIPVMFALFGTTFSSWTFMIVALGSALALLLTKELFGPVAQFFYAKFVGMKANAAKKEAEKNKNNKVKKARAPKPNKSAEPEEAIFIGINDY